MKQNINKSLSRPKTPFTKKKALHDSAKLFKCVFLLFFLGERRGTIQMKYYNFAWLTS